MANDIFIGTDVPSQPQEENVDPKTVAPWERPGKRLPLFAHYCIQPKGISFTTQEPDEYIVLFLRRHIVTNLSWVTITILLNLIPVLIFFVYPVIDQFLPIPSLPAGYLIVFFLFYYLAVAGYAFLQFISWFYNVGIISNKRVVDIDFKDIMYREIAFVRINEVVDVEFHGGGFLHGLFDYGDVFVQTQGIKPNFEFQKIPHPDDVTDILLDLKGKQKNAEQ